MITNSNIVLTGASSGIGLEVLRLLEQGAGNRILAVSRRAGEKLKAVGANVTVFDCDISSAQGVDAVFDKADEVFGGQKIDIFYANAGFPYYEEYNYADWQRVEAMFNTNTLSPIYTYSKYLAHLNGRSGKLCYTVSAIGQMAMPEKPKNLQLTCLYPVATDTNFFRVANEAPFEKPFPVQKPDVVARKMVKGIETGKKAVSPCALFALSKVLMGVCPPVRTVYWQLEKNKLERFKKGIGKK